jgi:hypothetical protein
MLSVPLHYCMYFTSTRSRINVVPRWVFSCKLGCIASVWSPAGCEFHIYQACSGIWLLGASLSPRLDLFTSYRVSWIFDLWRIAFVWIRSWYGRDHHPAKCFETVTSGRIAVVTPRDTSGDTGLDPIGLWLWSWWNENPSAPRLLSAVGPIACIGWRFGQSPMLHEDHLYLVSWMVKLTGTPAHTVSIWILHWS